MRNPFKRRQESGFARGYSEVFRGYRAREHKRLRWFRNKWVLAGLTIIVLLAAAGGYLAYLYFDANAKVQIEPDAKRELTPRREGRPFNALLVGSDSRVGLSEKEQQDLGADDVNPATGEPIVGERADTLILAHVDPATDHVIMVQFPRDLYVPLASGGKGKINTALMEGQGHLIRTVEKVTGLGINRYAQVNIAGFKEVVDAIGGVDVCVPEPIPFDPATGIEVKNPGMVHFGGERAVRFVRSRKVFAGGDFARIQNQQKFLAAAIEKVTSLETLLHPSRVDRLLDAAGRHIKTSETLWGLLRLGERFRAFNPDDYEAYTVPNLGVVNDERGSIVAPDNGAMRKLFTAIERNESPAEADGVPSLDPSTIRVGVYNGSFKQGVARKAARALERATRTSTGSVSIDRSDITNADRFNYDEAVIRYNRREPEAARMAEYVSAAVPKARVVKGATDPGLDVEVIVGKRRFRTRKVTPIVPIPIPRPGALPEACRA